MNHPYELLADFIDGTLDEGDLAGVQAHLDECASCREDIAHSTAGREAARSLPQATAPTDLHQRIVAVAGGRGNETPGWYRWAGVAAAAAVVVAIAIALPNVGGGEKERAEDTRVSAEAQVDVGGAESFDNVTVSVEKKNYDDEALQQLASGSRSAALSSGVEGPAKDTIIDPAAAVSCVDQASQSGATGRLIRLIEARFNGRDAYIAVYLEDLGEDQRPDLVAVWVAARDNCSILSLASSQI